MDRATWLLVGSLVALLLAGGGICVALTGQNTGDTTATLDVSPADGTATANETVAFDDLSPARRDTFERARNTTDSVDVPSTVSYGVFANYGYVRYGNRTYETAVAVA